MLTKRELSAIKKALPNNGYQKIADKLMSINKETVRKTLTEPKRYNRDIIYAALALIEDEKLEKEKLKMKIKEVVS